MTVPAEPILIGGHSVYVKFFAMPRQADDPRRIEGTFTLVGPEGVLTLDALVGPQGEPGQPSPIIRPEWGSTVTDAEDLPDTSTLDESDDGRAWYIDGQWHVYSDHDGDYHVIQGSIAGPPGVTPDISITAELVDGDGPSIDIDESGPSTSPNFHFNIPTGLLIGPEGPSAAIETASDYDDTVTAEPGDFLVFGDDDKWHPESPTLLSPKMYTIPHSNFTEYSGSNVRQLIASLAIPAQAYDWYPHVTGHLQLQRSLLSSAQVEVEVRIGDTGDGTGETAPLCGLGPYDPQWALLDAISIAHIMPHFSDTGNPTRAVSPDTSEGRCLAGDGKTIYVYLHRKGGLGSTTFTREGAQVCINVQPVE